VTNRRIADCDLAGFVFTEAVFETRLFESVSFRAVSASGAKFCGKRFIAVDFTSANLEDADFSGSVFVQCTFARALLSGANFERACFLESTLDGAKLQGVLLRGATLRKASLRGTDLSSTIETRYSREREGSRLQMTSQPIVTRETCLDDCDFTEADLSGAKLRAVSATLAIFRRTNLEHTDLSGGNFSDADFRESQLEGADFNPMTGVSEIRKPSGDDEWSFTLARETILRGALFARARGRRKKPVVGQQ
jgi:uncharacterized protein YjbI with pentapeptide repeats